MLTLSATLQAAQQRLDVDPRVAVTVGDVPPESVRLAELSTIYRGGEGDVSFDCCLDLPTGQWARIRVDGAGTVFVQVVTDPTSAAQWSTWQQLATGAYANGPCCVSSGTDGYFRARWLNADGHSMAEGYWLRGTSSAWTSEGGFIVDAGAGFLVTGMASPDDGTLALARFFYVVSGGQLFETHLVSGTGWTVPAGDGGAYTGSPTIGASYRPVGAPNGDGNVYLVIAHGSPSQVVLRSWIPGSSSWGSFTSGLLAAGVNSGYSYSWPRIAETRADQLRHALTWVESAPAPLGQTAQLTWTPTHLFLPQGIPLAGSLVPGGIGLTRGVKCLKDGASPSYWYLVSAAWVARAPADATTTANGQRVVFPMDQIVDLRIEEPRPNHPASVQVTVLNPNGELATAGQPGPYLGLRQWSQLVIALGYHTSAGDETAWQIPAWIESIAFRDDVATGTPLVTFFCVDAWGLLDRMVNRWAQTFADDALDVILARIWWHVCGLLDSGMPASLTGQVLASFVLRAGEPLGAAGRRLLELAGDVLRFATLATSADGVGWDAVGFSVVSWATGGSVYSYGPGAGQHPIVQGNVAPIASPSATSVEVTGASTTSLARDYRAVALFGRELLARVVDKTLDTQAKTDTAAAGLLAELVPEARGGEITTLANVGIELGDQVDVTIASAGLSAAVFTVVGILTTWSRATGLLQTLQLEGTN